LHQQAELQARVEAIDRQLAANQRAFSHHEERQAKWTARCTARRQELEDHNWRRAKPSWPSAWWASPRGVWVSRSLPCTARRQAAVEAVDVEGPIFERDLEKDQIMTNWQNTLLNLHHWCQEHYLPEAWRTLRLETATKLLYRKRGRVRCTADRIKKRLRRLASSSMPSTSAIIRDG